MREVPADDCTSAVACRGDGAHVEELPGVVLNAAEHDERQTVALALDGREDVLRAQEMLAVARLERDEGSVEIETVVGDLGFEGVLPFQPQSSRPGRAPDQMETVGTRRGS